MKGVKKLEKIGWMVKYHHIALRGELELEFVKNAKKKVNLVIILQKF
jgi:hypothetical protein